MTRVVVCNVCRHEWTPRARKIKDIRCPKCKSNKSLSIRYED